MEQTQTARVALEDPGVVSLLKQAFAPDGGAEREHNAADGSLGFGAIHYGLVINLRPRRALVIGSRHGYVPAIVALAMKFNGVGTLDFVDANYRDATDGFSVAYGGVGAWDGDAARHFRALDLGAHVQVHVMTSSAFFSRCRETYGYVYLDGNHSYAGCRFDFDQAVARAEPGAIIAVHDLAVDHPAFGVRRLFDDLDDARYGKLRLGAWPGLGIIQLK
jgi:hypothetical protein